MTTTRRDGITRRGLLGGAGAALALTTLPPTARAQANGTVEILFTNQAVSGPLKEAIQAEAACTLNDQPFQSSTDVVSRLIAPGSGSRYDLMGSTMEFSRVPVMGERAGAEKVGAFDLAQIPNFKNIDPMFKGQVGERDGKTYMIPICLGYDSMVYNRDKVPEEDTQSWSLIFEDKYAGKIGWFDVAHQMIMAAGLYLGHAAPEKMDDKQLDEVIKFLMAKKKNVRAMWTTFAQGASLMASGEIVCSYTAVPMRADLQLKGFNVAGAWPKEGVISVTLAAYMPKDNRNPKGAHAVVNSMLGERYASQLTKQSGYLPCSTLGRAAMASLDPKVSGFGVLDGSTKHHGLNFPANITKWIEGWTKVKSA